MDWLPLLKFVHVYTNITTLRIPDVTSEFLWLRTSEPAHVAYAIRGVRAAQRHHRRPRLRRLLFVTGVLIVATRTYGFDKHSIKAAITLYI